MGLFFIHDLFFIRNICDYFMNLLFKINRININQNY